MFLETSNPVCTYPWYLPDGLSPDGLLAAACESPEALTAYVTQNLDQHALFRLLAESFRRMPLHDSHITRSVFRPLLTAPSAEERCFEATTAMALLYQKLSSGSTDIVYTLSDNEPCWSISWPHVFMSLDELLAPPNPGDPLEKEDTYSIRHNQFVGWLGILMLPTLRIYDPCAYECAVVKLYSTLFNNVTLIANAYMYHRHSPVAFKASTFKKLREVNFDSFEVTQPGLIQALDLVHGYTAKKLLVEDPELSFFRNSNGEALFNYAVKSQLLLVVPFLRSLPADNIPVSTFLASYDISINVLRCKLEDPRSLTRFYPSNSETIDVLVDREEDLNPRLRYLTLFQLLVDTSVISLVRNTRFLNHIYSHLAALFGYSSGDSKKLRSSLIGLFRGWNEFKDKHYSEILALVDSDPSTLDLEDVYPRSNEIFTKLMFTVSLSYFCEKYTVEISSREYRLYGLDSLDYMAAKYEVLHSQVWTDRFGISCTDPVSSVLTNPQYSRNSNHYLSAYTVSLGITMLNWYNAARKQIPSFDPCSHDPKRVLSTLLQYVGVFATSISGRKVVTINVPRYLYFLTRMGRISPTLSAGIKNVLSEYPTSRKRERSLSPAADEKARDRFNFLTYKVVKDIFVSDLVSEVETANLRETILVKHEAKNSYFELARINLDSWLFGVSLDGLSRDYVRRFKYRPLDKKDKERNNVRNAKGRLSRRHKIPHTINMMVPGAEGTRTYTLKVLRLNGKTFFGLPWKRFYLSYGVLPPKPSSVYKTAQLSGGNRGMYNDFFESVSTDDVKEEYVQKEVVGGLDTERGLLKPFVQVFEGTPYMFTLDGLFCEDKLRTTSTHFMYIIPRLRKFLESLNLMSNFELKSLSVKPTKRVFKYDSERVAHETEKREKSKQRLSEGKPWSPKDERVRFTSIENDLICEFYRPGITNEGKKKLMQSCSGHSWDVISIHAKSLCKKMIAAGVTDPTKLPYIRVTPEIKKLLKKMDE